MLRSLLTGSVAAVAMMASTVAMADPIDGTGSVTLLGATSSLPLLAVGTVIGSSAASPNSIFAGGTGDLNLAFSFMDTASFTASVGSAFSFTAAFGSFAGTIQLASAGGPVNSRTLDVYALGTFTPLGVLGSFTAGPMSVTLSATQTGGSGSQVSVSYTLASPPAPPTVSEPATLALLGAGLLGLAAVRRRKSA